LTTNHRWSHCSAPVDIPVMFLVCQFCCLCPREDVVSQTGLSSIGDIISCRRLGLFGRVARLDSVVPARDALECAYACHTEIYPPSGWRRPPTSKVDLAAPDWWWLHSLIRQEWDIPGERDQRCGPPPPKRSDDDDDHCYKSDLQLVCILLGYLSVSSKNAHLFETFFQQWCSNYVRLIWKRWQVCIHSLAE